MRGRWRGTWLFAGIAAALAGVFGLRVLSFDSATTRTADAPVVDLGSGGSGGSSGSGGTDGTDGSGSAGSDGGGTSSGGSTDSGSSSGSGGGSSSSGGSSGAGGTQKIAGDVEQTQFGPYQVAVTFSGAKITNVTELQTPQDGRSLAINQYAAPTLEREVIASQSARVDSVSGATLTSEAYAASVQSAIDKRG